MQDISEENVLSRFHDFNCEWLQRPNIALSEMAQMLRENFPLLVAQTPGVLDPDFVESILQHFRPLSGALSRPDNKDKTNSEPATREDVVAVMKTITGQPELEERIREGLNAAGALFMTCVHLLVPLTLMRNPQDFAEKARRTPANQSFKEDPSPRRMCDFVLDGVTKRRRPVHGASIWDAAEDEQEDSEPIRSRSHSRPKCRTSPPSCREAEADSAGETSPQQPPARKSHSVDWTTTPASRRGKRPGGRTLTSTPVKRCRKQQRVAAPSSSEGSDVEESLPLAAAKASKDCVKRASAGKAPTAKPSSLVPVVNSAGCADAKKSGLKKNKKKNHASSSSSFSSSCSSSSSESSGDKGKPCKKAPSVTPKQTKADLAKKPSKQSAKSKSCSATQKGKGKPEAKEPAQKKQKLAASKTTEDDVWAPLANAYKEK